MLVTFEQVFEWFSFLTFSLDFASTACMTADFHFVDRLIFYIVTPLSILFLMCLPTLYAKCRRHPALGKLVDSLMNWSSWLLYLVQCRSHS